jgi:hypothetical protein
MSGVSMVLGEVAIRSRPRAPRVAILGGHNGVAIFRKYRLLSELIVSRFAVSPTLSLSSPTTQLPTHRWASSSVLPSIFVLSRMVCLLFHNFAVSC